MKIPKNDAIREEAEALLTAFWQQDTGLMHKVILLHPDAFTGHLEARRAAFDEREDAIEWAKTIAEFYKKMDYPCAVYVDGLMFRYGGLLDAKYYESWRDEK